MVTQGIIDELYTSQGTSVVNTCKVHIPLFDTCYSAKKQDWKLKGKSVNGDFTVDAFISIPPGITCAYRKGDYVWVAFDKNLADKPVVIGLIKEVDDKTTDVKVVSSGVTCAGAVKANSINVSDAATLPADTKINGQVGTLGSVISSVASLSSSISTLQSSMSSLSAAKKYLLTYTFSYKSTDSIPQTYNIKLTEEVTLNKTGKEKLDKALDKTDKDNKLYQKFISYLKDKNLTTLITGYKVPIKEFVNVEKKISTSPIKYNIDYDYFTNQYITPKQVIEGFQTEETTEGSGTTAVTTIHYYKITDFAPVWYSGKFYSFGNASGDTFDDNTQPQNKKLGPIKPIFLIRTVDERTILKDTGNVHGNSPVIYRPVSLESVEVNEA